MTDTDSTSYPRIRLSLLQKNVNLTMTRLFKASGLDITREQEVILRELSERDGVNQADLAGRVGQDRNNLSRTLSILASKNLIERDGDHQDRRKSVVRITPAGRALQREVYESVNEYRRILFTAFTQEEIQVFSDLVKRLNKNLEGFLSQGGVPEGQSRRPFQKGLSGRGSHDSRRFADLPGECHADPDHPRTA